MKNLFDKTFWRMTIGFLCIVALGIGGIFIIGQMRASGEVAEGASTVICGGGECPW